MASIRQAVIRGGFGAGVGAALAMMLVMAVLRFTTNTTSIPELMEDSLVRLTGGQINSFFINNLGVGGKSLLLVMIAEAPLLGACWGWLSPTCGSGGEPLAATLPVGLAFGLIWAAAQRGVSSHRRPGLLRFYRLEVTAPPEIAQAIDGDSLAP